VCALLVLACTTPELAESEEAANDLAYVVPFELGQIEFAPGDNIVIESVRGTSQLITTGQTYCVEGTYTLASCEEANLAFFATVPNSGPTPIDPKQTVRVQKGTGSFRLIKKMGEEGYLHLSFYPIPSGRSSGGVYFGQGKWVLRQSDAPGNASSASPRSAAGAPSSLSASASRDNRALYDFLGSPVEPPVNLDPKYTPEGLSNAVQAAAAAAGVTLQKLEIDDSEYPFLVGVVCGNSEFTKLGQQIKQMDGYAYNGSCGSHDCHAMNIVPYATYSADMFRRIGRRLTVRQQMLYERISSP